MPPETTLNVMSLLSFFRALPFFCFQQNSQKKKWELQKQRNVPIVRCCQFSLSGHDTAVLSGYHTPLCTLNLWLIFTQNHSFLPPLLQVIFGIFRIPTQLPCLVLYFSLLILTFWLPWTQSSVPAGVPNSSQFANLHQSLTFPVRSTFYPLSRVYDWHHHDRNHPAERTDFAAQYSKTFRCWYCYIMLWNIWNCMKVDCWRGRFISSSTSVLPFNVA